MNSKAQILMLIEARKVGLTEKSGCEIEDKAVESHVKANIVLRHGLEIIKKADSVPFE